MYYFKNIFCLLVLTVSAQDWPVGRVSDKKDTISIWKNVLTFKNTMIKVRSWLRV